MMWNKERYTEEDLLHWECNPNRQCMEVRNRYGYVVMSVTDFTYLSQSKEDQKNKRLLFEIVEDYYDAQKCRIQEESES